VVLQYILCQQAGNASDLALDKYKSVNQQLFAEIEWKMVGICLPFSIFIGLKRVIQT